MVSKKIVITNPSGIHARPAGLLVKEAKNFKCAVTVKTPDKTVSAKSVLTLMTAAIKNGTEIELCCDGEDEAEALEKLSALIESGLGE